jgi:CheY-like chemotaxis protein
MKVEVRCPDCERLWYVDRSTTGEMLCPGCMTRIPLEGLETARPVEEPASTTDLPADDNVHVDSPPVAEVEPTGSAAGSPAEVAPDPSTEATKLTQDESRELEAQPAQAGPAPVTGGVTGSALEAATDAAAARASRSTPVSAYEQVVCPRCNLHFQPRQRPSERAVAQKTILVVDDLAYFRQIAKDALEPTFGVKTAATADEARELIAAGGIDLLVLDLTLDGSNAGRELLAELRPKPCPILIFTAQDESEMYGENWENLKRLGADDLVIKGMQVAESLARKASTLLGVPVDDEDPIG